MKSLMPDWKFAAADTVADCDLHGRLLVGRKVPILDIAASAKLLDDFLAGIQVNLFKGDQLVEHGCGANVLDSPLRALHHFLTELRQCPGAPDLIDGDLITTGTWTDALSIEPGEHWVAEFSAPLARLSADFQ
jgi:2-keto-4-pentenoate hydratase